MKIFMSSNNRLKLKHYRVEFGSGENSMSVPEYQADDYTMDMQAMSKEDAAAEVHFGLEYPENMQYRVCTIDPDTLERTDNWEYFSFDSDITSASYTKWYYLHPRGIYPGTLPSKLEKDIVDVENYDSPKYIDSLDRDAYAYVEFAHPVDEDYVEEYSDYMLPADVRYPKYVSREKYKMFQEDINELSDGNVPRRLKKYPLYVLNGLLDIQNAIDNGDKSFSTITKDIADIMKKYGFQVTESGVGYKITL